MSSAPGKHGRVLGRAVPSREGDRVTTLELFFDLAFVFAFTQLSRLMAQEHDVLGVLQALLILALLWWSWTAYGWLSNLAHADEGAVRVAMIIGMTAMFVAGVTVLEAYDDEPGGLFAPLVFVVAYLVARITHAVAFLALSEPALRRRTLLSVAVSVIPAGALLTAGALLGAPWQIWLTLAAVALEPSLAYRTSIGIAWRLPSTVHFTERHGLIVILALGESVLSVGSGATAGPISAPILAGVITSMAICVALWWAYFGNLARAAEVALLDIPATARARAAADAYTYLHLALVTGIILVALGLEVAMAHIDESAPLGVFGAAALGTGLACYLAGTALISRRLLQRWAPTRLAFAAGLALAVPGIALLTPLTALGAVAATLVAFVIAEAAAGARSRSSEPARIAPEGSSAACQ